MAARAISLLRNSWRALTPLAHIPYRTTPTPYSPDSLAGSLVNIRTLTYVRDPHTRARSRSQPGVCRNRGILYTVLLFLYIGVFVVGVVEMLFIFFDRCFLLFMVYLWCSGLWPVM